LTRILITRAPHQASELADLLRAAGAEPILIPAIELVEPTSYEVLDSAIPALDQFHWLLFTSSNAVEAFAKRSPNPYSLIPNPCRVAAIGPATAHAVETHLHRKPDLIPPQAVAESFAAALAPHATQKDGSPTHFLLVRAESARDHLPETLRAAGAEVTIAPAYRTAIPAESATQLKALFADRESWPAAITFTSSSTAANLFTLLESASLTLPPEVLRASIGPITSQTLRDRGYPPQVEAAESTITALVEILVKTLGLSKSS
jgi:uroporphyrinogen-III synthase